MRAYPDNDGNLILKDGEYGQDKRGVWYFRPPGGYHMGSLVRHTVTEHKDGTITVAPSILLTDWEFGKWHGYLIKGEWKQLL